MKKKSVIGIGIIAIIVIAIVISGYLYFRPELLGNINHNYKEKTTIASSVSFSGKAGDRIKFSLRSNIKNGDLEIVLLDSTGNEVYELAKATALETFFTLNKEDSYTVAAECSDFIGSYSIKVYKAD